MPKVDLEIKHIADDIAIWRIYPGQSRDLGTIFRDTNTVFLDLPSLQIQKDINDQLILNAQIARAWDIREWHRSSEDEKPPFPRKLEDYIGVVGNQATGPQFGNIRRLYFDAQVGDLVLVPVEAGFASYIMIGEITHPFSPSDHQRIPIYGNDTLPFRRVDWINPRQLKRQISSALAAEMSGRLATRLLGRDQDEENQGKLYVEVFELSYVNFVYRDVSEYVFDAPLYKQRPRDIFPGAELLSALLALGNLAHDSVKLINPFENAGSAADSEYAERGVEIFEINFASPGEYRIKMRSRAAVLLAAVTFVACAAAGFAISEMKDVEIVDHTPLPPDLAQETADIVEQITQGIPFDRIQELAILERRAQEKVGFRQKARARR